MPAVVGDILGRKSIRVTVEGRRDRPAVPVHTANILRALREVALQALKPRQLLERQPSHRNGIVFAPLRVAGCVRPVGQILQVADARIPFMPLARNAGWRARRRRRYRLQLLQTHAGLIIDRHTVKNLIVPLEAACDRNAAIQLKEMLTHFLKGGGAFHRDIGPAIIIGCRRESEIAYELRERHNCRAGLGCDRLAPRCQGNGGASRHGNNTANCSSSLGSVHSRLLPTLTPATASSAALTGTAGDFLRAVAALSGLHSVLHHGYKTSGWIVHAAAVIRQ